MSIVDIFLLATLGILALTVVFRVLWARKKLSHEIQEKPQSSQTTPSPKSEKEHITVRRNRQKTVPEKKEKINENNDKNEKSSEIPQSSSNIPNTDSTSPLPDLKINIVEEKTIEIPAAVPSNGSEQSLIAVIGNFAAPLLERFSAIHEAGKLGLVDAVPALIEVLYEPDPNISAAAADSLGKIGDPRAIEPLMEITKRADARLLRDAPQKVDITTEPSKVPELNLVNAEPPELNPFKYKEMTVFKIDLLPKEYFQPDGTPIPRRDLVVRGLKDNDQQLRKMAAKAAIGLKDPDIVSALIEVLKNPFEVESVRFLAAEALGGMEDKSAAQPLMEALNDENVAVRYSAASALSQIGGGPAVEALIKALEDPNEFVRSSVAYALGKIGNPQAIEALFAAVTDSTDVVRFSAAKALGNFDSEKILQDLDKRLNGADHNMKLALMEVLGHIKDEKAIKMLIDVLRDPDPDLSFKASLALMSHENIDVIDELIEASRRLDQELLDWLRLEGKGGKTTTKRHSAQLRALNEEFLQFQNLDGGGAEHSGEGIAKLKVALRHTSPNVRGCAANALGDFKDTEAVDLLLFAISDPHEYVRSSAVSSLGKIADPRTLEQLIKLAEDPSEDVRYSLAIALKGFKDQRGAVILANLANKDASRNVKRAARMVLDSIGKTIGQ